MRIMLMSILCALLISSPSIADDKCEKEFCRLDKNNDNYLSKKEFVDGKVKLNKEKTVKLFPDMRGERMKENSLKEKAFDRMDKNHDGNVSRDEWRQVAPNILEVRF